MLDSSEQDQRTEDCDRLPPLSREVGEDDGRRGGPAPVVGGRCDSDGGFLPQSDLHPEPAQSEAGQSSMAGYQAVPKTGTTW